MCQFTSLREKHIYKNQFLTENRLEITRLTTKWIRNLNCSRPENLLPVEVYVFIVSLFQEEVE